MPGWFRRERAWRGYPHPIGNNILPGNYERSAMSDVTVSRGSVKTSADPGSDPLAHLSELVGERTVPQLWHENYWFRRHEAAYLALAPVVARSTESTQSTVLEAGSGEGYGVGLLRRAGAGRVVAL